jgi:hypothetical protein
MKTNIKLRVTPTQSEAVQKICFANNIFWNVSGKQITNADAPYLFIQPNELWYSNDYNSYVETQKYIEVDADLFIRTNGTCEEPAYLTTPFDTSELAKSPTPYDECQFAKYGFEKPEFECELWKVETSRSIEYIHGLVLNDYAHPMGDLRYHKWNKKTGEVLIGCASKNLKPIKKHWYRYLENFPCLLTNGKDFVLLTEKDYEKWDGSYIGAGYRPATKEEVHNLIMEGII